MKALLRSIVLCSILSTPVLAESVPTKTINQNQSSIVGTWSWNFLGLPVILIFDSGGVISALTEKTYGDYKYYQLSGAEYSRLMNRISGEASEIELSLRYKQQGNIIEVTNPDGNVEKNTLDFTNNGRTVRLSTKSQVETISFQKVSDGTELPKNTELQTTVEGHFHGLQKLIALQTAQSDYWVQKKRFAKRLEDLKIKPLPDSDRLYRYEIVKQNPRQSVVAAIPTQPNLRSFVLQLDRVGRRQEPFKGILCATDRPIAKQPPLPQLKSKNLTCPTTTHEVDFNTSIQQSLLKVK